MESGQLFSTQHSHTRIQMGTSVRKITLESNFCRLQSKSCFFGEFPISERFFFQFICCGDVFAVILLMPMTLFDASAMIN